jgi:hypothetical protein
MSQKFCKNCNKELKREDYKAKHFFDVAVYCSRQCFEFKTRKPKVITKCPVCANDVKSFPSNPKICCSVKCSSTLLRQKSKGTVIKANGYRLVKTNSSRANNHGYEFEHRLVVEKHFNRLLLRHEVVHHINGVKDDNRIENLIVLTHSAHSKFHSSQPTNYFKKHGKDERLEQLAADERARQYLIDAKKFGIKTNQVTIITTK